MNRPIFKISEHARLSAPLLIDVTENETECSSLVYGLHPSMTGVFSERQKDSIAESLYLMGQYTEIIPRSNGSVTIDYHAITNEQYLKSFKHYYDIWISTNKKSVMVSLRSMVEVDSFLNLRALYDQLIGVLPYLEPKGYRMQTKEYAKLDDLSKLNRAVPLEVNSSIPYYKTVPKIEVSEKIVMSFTDKYGNEITIAGIDREKMIEQIEKLK